MFVVTLAKMIAAIQVIAEEVQCSMRHAFAIWIKRLLRDQLPEAVIDGVDDLQ